jgi:hypothetical protein
MSEERAQVTLQRKHGPRITARVDIGDMGVMAVTVGESLPRDDGYMTLELEDRSIVVVPNREVVAVWIRPVPEGEDDYD